VQVGDVTRDGDLGSTAVPLPKIVPHHGANPTVVHGDPEALLRLLEFVLCIEQQIVRDRSRVFTILADVAFPLFQPTGINEEPFAICRSLIMLGYEI